MERSYIKRKVEETLLEVAKYFPVIIVTGPRQAGKSTLIKHLFPNFEHCSLEDYDVRSVAIDDPKRFLQPTAKGMVILVTLVSIVKLDSEYDVTNSLFLKYENQIGSVYRIIDKILRTKF